MMDEEDVQFLYPEYIGGGDRLVKKRNGEWVVIGIVADPPTVDDLWVYFTVDTEDGAIRMEVTSRLGHRVPVILRSQEQAP